MKILNVLFSRVFRRKRIEEIERFGAEPEAEQARQLRYLLEYGRHSEWGRKYGYQDLRNAKQFAERVPVSAYEDVFPYIERTLKGEESLLWPGEVNWFAKSSGTTNDRSKFIPVSKESLYYCHFKGGKDLISLYLNNFPDSKLFRGKMIGIGGSLYPNERNPGSYYGDVSAVIMKNLPIWVQSLRTPGLDVALMDEWEGKIDQMARITSQENVINISGVPTWTIVLIRRILELTGKSNILEVWPQLEVFSHGAVAFDPYRETFRQLIPSDKMRYFETYNASEGFFGIQDRHDRRDMLLMLDYGIYYEFAPLSELDKDHPETVGIGEVEKDKNYALIISTNGGLWRYLIGDTVKFTSLYPHRIQITGRTKHFINAFGEEVIMENAQQAIGEACRRTGAVIADYTAAPVYLGTESKGGHELLIEFERCPDDLERFTDALDEALRAANSDYDAKRYRDMALVRPIVRPMASGAFYTWMKSRGKLGGQHKVPRLANHRRYVDEILNLSQTMDVA